MLSIDEINESIIELEQRDTTFSNCERLAPLYIVRDHLKNYKTSEPQLLALTAKNEFIQAVNGKNSDAVWNIISKVMDQVIKPLHPAVYDRMIQEIQEI